MVTLGSTLMRAVLANDCGRMNVMRIPVTNTNKNTDKETAMNTVN
jgi:hypothetical protein